MNRKEIQKISLQYRTLSSQMLKMNSQEEMYCIQQFFDFISEAEIIRNYINECKTQEYDFEHIFADKDGEMYLCFQRNKKNWLVMDINCCNIYLMDLKVL